MNFLIVYATTEGQTRKICEFAADRIKMHKHDSALVDAGGQASADIKLHGYDGVIIAASLHVGKFQAGIEEFVRARHDTLNGMRTAFLPVSLAAASKDEDDAKGLAACIQRFTDATEWRPGRIHKVAGAFRFTQYDFFKRWGMKLIAYQKGVSTDTSRDLELTDWLDLKAFVDSFVASVEVARQPTAG